MKLTDYPSVEAKDYKSDFKFIPKCPQCFSKQVTLFKEGTNRYLCKKCVVVFKWEN